MLSLILMAVDDPEMVDVVTSLYREYEKYLYKIAYRYTGNHHDSEEVVNQTFLVLLERGRMPQKPGKQAKVLLATVAARIAVNTFNRNSYRQNHQISFEDEDGKDIIDVLAAPEQDPETRMVLEQCLERLPSDEKEILILKDFYGYKTSEIADIKGMKQDTVQKKIKKGKELIKEILTEENEL